ncbi:MAG: hypothetical protein AAGG68_05655 [Bacteroidota bacterium]
MMNILDEKEGSKKYSNKEILYALSSLLLLAIQVVANIIILIQSWALEEIVALLFVAIFILSVPGLINCVSAIKRKEESYKKYIALSISIIPVLILTAAIVANYIDISKSLN